MTVIDDLRSPKSCPIYAPELPPGATGDVATAYKGAHEAPSLENGTRLSEMSADERAVYGVAGDGKLTVYRVAPAEGINSGDWVSVDKAVSEKAAKRSGYKLTEAKVDAKDLVRRVGDDENEFGFIGKLDSRTKEMHGLKVPEAPPQDVLPVAAKKNDFVHFSRGTDPATGAEVPAGKGRVARIDKEGNMIVNTGTAKKPVWVQTRQRNLTIPQAKPKVENPLGKAGYRSRLTSDEQAALDSYKENGYRQLNSGLRSDKALGSTLQARADAIDRAIEKGTLSNDTRLHRAFRPTGGLQLQPGDVITDKAFVSTSASTKTPLEIVDSHKAKNELFYNAHINAPAGTNVAYVDIGQQYHNLSQENEILLPRGSSFRVISSKVDKQGRHELELELISVAKAANERAVIVVSDQSTLASTLALQEGDI